MATLKPGQVSFTLKELEALKLSPTLHLTTQLLNKAVKLELACERSSGRFKLSSPNRDDDLKSAVTTLRYAVEDEPSSITDLVIECLVGESLEFLLDLMGRRGLTPAPDVEPPPELRKLVQSVPLTQVFMLLWQGMQSLHDADIRILTATESPHHVINLVSRNALSILKRYCDDSRTVKSFKIPPSGVKQSVLSKILFEHLLGINDSYYNDPALCLP